MNEWSYKNWALENGKDLDKLNFDEWDFEYLEDLCKAAGLEKEFRQATVENFEAVAERAAELLDVDLYE